LPGGIALLTSKQKQRDDFLNETSVIAGGVVLDRAFVTGSCDILIKGIVNGDIDLDGNVEIGAEGQVNGNITCKNCVISGCARGDVSCSGDLEIRQYGELRGNISVASLSIEKGGCFAGSCNQAKTQPQAQSQAPPQASQKITPVILKEGRITEKNAIG